MTVYVIRGNTVHPEEDAENFKSSLPPAFYSVEKSLSGFYLQRIPEIDIPSGKMYGDVHNKRDRVIQTFHERADNKKNTGVLLSGTKGSGKTLLSKVISHKLLEQGVSTIVVNAIPEDQIQGFIKFVNLIDSKCVLLFDEFEKNFNRDDQAQFLSLFDGTSTGPKMFVVTVNDSYLLNSFMLNRPGRLYYRFNYSGMEETAVRDYLSDNLVDKSAVDKTARDIISVFKNTCTFDILQCVVEEMNRFSLSLRDAIDVLNIDIDNDEYSVKLFYKGELVLTRVVDNLNFISLRDPKNEKYIEFSYESHFETFDSVKNCMVFKDGDYVAEVTTISARNKFKSYFLDAI